MIRIQTIRYFFDLIIQEYETGQRESAQPLKIEKYQFTVFYVHEFLNCFRQLFGKYKVSEVIFQDCSFEKIFSQSENFHFDPVREDNIYQPKLDRVTFSRCEISEVNLVNLQNIGDVFFQRDVSLLDNIKDYIESNKKKNFLQIDNFQFGSYESQLNIQNIDIFDVHLSTCKKFYAENVRFGSKNNELHTKLDITSSYKDSKFHFKNCKFYICPNFQFKMENRIKFEDCVFDDFSEDSAAKYRKIKTDFHEINNEQDADYFSSLELQSRFHQASLFKKVRSLAGWYGIYNQFGRNLTRPMLFILAQLIVFSGIYLSPHCLAYQWFDKMPMWINLNEEHLALKVAFIKSLINTLGPIGWLYETDAIQYKNFGALILSFLQKLVATIMWFLLILQIRRRFKLS